jgi:ribosomal protein S18 acetylase RimI-like enzyme
MSNKLNIIEVSLDYLEELVPLFDQYRIFYKQVSDLRAAREFLTEKIENQASTIFLAHYNDLPVGFVQLYPSYSSVSLQKLTILNDLYVNENFRSKGIATALLKKAKEYARENNSKGLVLETAVDNPAKKLYERLDWSKEEGFLHYFWKNEKSL